jgi:hypothetical protein
MTKLIFATVSAFAMATSANALTLINAQVTGSANGTVWNTNNADSFYTLFLQNPGLGDYLNPNDQAVNFGVNTSGETRVLLAGEGYFPNTNVDSDPVYNLLLSFDGGQTLTGSYTPTTNTFLAGGSFSSGNTTYSLTEFSYRRFLGDAVQAHVATPGGDGNDYVGNFRINAATAAVPEPATWAMMIGGFGLAGFAARRRPQVARVSA